MANKKNIVNFYNEINIYEKSSDEIDKEIKPYLTTNNIGKYLIIRDDSGEAQTDTYMVYQIINEDKTKTTPLVSIKKIGQQLIQFNGGQTTKKYRRTRGRKYRNIIKSSYNTKKYRKYISKKNK